MVQKRDNKWLKYLLQKKKGLYNQTDTPDKICNMLIEGTSRIDVIKKIKRGTFENCNIKEEISNIRYHRLYHGTAGQKEDEFDNKVKDQRPKVTLIIPFTKLDVMVEIKTKKQHLLGQKDGNGSLLHKTAHVHVHCTKYAILRSRKHCGNGWKVD